MGWRTLGVKFANAFSVVENKNLARGLSLRSNPGLKLANAFGVASGPDLSSPF